MNAFVLNQFIQTCIAQRRGHEQRRSFMHQTVYGPVPVTLVITPDRETVRCEISTVEPFPAAVHEEVAALVKHRNEFGPLRIAVSKDHRLSIVAKLECKAALRLPAPDLGEALLFGPPAMLLHALPAVDALIGGAPLKKAKEVLAMTPYRNEPPVLQNYRPFELPDAELADGKESAK